MLLWASNIEKCFKVWTQCFPVFCATFKLTKRCFLLSITRWNNLCVTNAPFIHQLERIWTGTRRKCMSRRNTCVVYVSTSVPRKQPCTNISRGSIQKGTSIVTCVTSKYHIEFTFCNTRSWYTKKIMGRKMKHQKILHEGSENTKHLCDSCPYQTINTSHLKKHQESIHLGVKYPCSLCKYQATTKATLRRHQKTIHEGIKVYKNEVFDKDKFYAEVVAEVSEKTKH